MPAAWVSAGAAVLGALGGAGGSQQTQTSTPWEKQQPFLEYGFDQGKSALQNAMNMGTYSGPRVAGLNPFQTQGADYAADFAKNYGMQGASSMFNAGSGLMNAGMNYGQNAQNLFNRFGGDPTQQILANAAQYANNPYVDGVIDAQNRDVARSLGEQGLTGLALQATGSGNANNTRAGVQEAILRRGAMDRMADNASAIRSQFFGKGLEQSQNQYNQNLQNLLGANTQLLNGFNTGANAMVQGQGMAGNNYDFLNQAGSLYQNQQQREYDAAKQAFTEGQNTNLDLIGKYMGIINGNYGQTTTGTSGGGLNGAIQGGLGAGLAGLGVMGKLGYVKPFGGGNTVQAPTSSGTYDGPFAG